MLRTVFAGRRAPVGVFCARARGAAARAPPPTRKSRRFTTGFYTFRPVDACGHEVRDGRKLVSYDGAAKTPHWKTTLKMAKSKTAKRVPSRPGAKPAAGG